MRLLVDIERATGVQLPKTKLNEKTKRRRLSRKSKKSKPDQVAAVSNEASDVVAVEPAVSPLLGNKSEPAVTNG